MANIKLKIPKKVLDFIIGSGRLITINYETYAYAGYPWFKTVIGSNIIELIPDGLLPKELRKAIYGPVGKGSICKCSKP